MKNRGSCERAVVGEVMVDWVRKNDGGCLNRYEMCDRRCEGEKRRWRDEGQRQNRMTCPNALMGAVDEK